MDGIVNMEFEEALKEIKNGAGMRLPHWSNDVIIKAQYPDSNSKMTAPYLYAESFRDGIIRRVPWRETFPEMFSDEWIIVSITE